MIRIFENVERFTCGTVGQPGERTFFIQARSPYAFTSLSIEKSQVQALAERLRYMVKEIRSAHPLTSIASPQRDSAPLETPIEEDFRIGSIALFFDDESELIQIDLREVPQQSSSFDEALLAALQEDDDDIDDELLGDVEVVRVYIRPDQALAFSDRADSLMSAGRLPCPFCSMPINLNGHLCARANGYRR
jgi:uncharacterized repeat protein (TIGR03847 family)